MVFDDGQAETREAEQDGYTAFADPNFFLYHILSYLETPPHLRKALFPRHPDLRTAGALSSLDMPHHMRSEDVCAYREGVTTRSIRGASGEPVTLVECGLHEQVKVPLDLDPNTRVTVQIPPAAYESLGMPFSGKVVSPEVPRETAGYYWGYTVRQASSLSSVFTECPYDGGYDASIGTSERGLPTASLTDPTSANKLDATWMHMLLVFGGVAGLEAALANDQELTAAGVAGPAELFDFWINLVPGQGSRTIRTEEAVWVGLAALRPLVEARHLG